MPLFGQCAQRLDAKHRVVVPQAFRNAIGEAELHKGLVLTWGLDGCIWLFPHDAWDAATAELCTSTFGSPEARMLQRLLLGGAVEAMVDSHGRIELPPHLRERAGLDGEAVFVGAASRIEIWNPARWRALEAAAAERFEELAEAAPRLPR